VERGALAAFPRWQLTRRFALYRVTRREHAPWWFGSTLEGRFDLPAPRGTCYLAASAITALLEVIGPDRLGGLICRDLLRDRRLHRLVVPAPLSLADCSAQEAAAFGLTLEIHTLVPYDLPQAWALAFAEAGAEGLRYRARHDPAGAFSFALFGQAGAADWPVTEAGRPIDAALEAALESATGLRFAPIPTSESLELAPLPPSL
jgi:RES domain